ncbi:unnamed protein product [Amoebophrya sp. A120]|nr:unnamed protein product [Amoebophrya sp. A120]|eukprot:GSA120T00015189001.1
MKYIVRFWFWTRIIYTRKESMNLLWHAIASAAPWYTLRVLWHDK